LLAVIFVPVFFLVVRRFFKGSDRQNKLYAHELDGPDPTKAIAAAKNADGV